MATAPLCFDADPTCKKYCHASVSGLPWQRGGSMLSVSQERCYDHRREAPLKSYGKADHTTITVFVTYLTAWWQHAVSCQEYCHPSVLWCCWLGDRNCFCLIKLHASKPLAWKFCDMAYPLAFFGQTCFCVFILICLMRNWNIYLFIYYMV